MDGPASFTRLSLVIHHRTYLTMSSILLRSHLLHGVYLSVPEQLQQVPYPYQAQPRSQDLLRARFGFAFSSITSAVRRIISRRSWIPSCVCADTGTKIVLPPQSSGISSYSVSSCFTRINIRTWLIDLVDRNNDLNSCCFRMVDRLNCLWHNTVVRCNYQDCDICRVCTTHTHCSKCLMSRCIQECDLFSVDLDTTDAPMCCVIPPASRSVTLRVTDCIQKRCLTMVNMTHNTDNRWAFYHKCFRLLHPLSEVLRLHLQLLLSHREHQIPLRSLLLSHNQLPGLQLRSCPA